MVLILHPRDGIFFEAADAAIVQDSRDPLNYGEAFEFSQYTRFGIQIQWSALTGVINGVIRVQWSLLVDSGYVDKPGALFNLYDADGEDGLTVENATEKFYRILYEPIGITGGTISGVLTAKGS